MILVIGGDSRQIFTAKKLAEIHTVELTGFNKNTAIPENVRKRSTEKADIIVLPLPVSMDGIQINAKHSNESIPLKSIPYMLKENGIIFGGKFSPEIREIFKGMNVCDYFEREELSVYNAVPTAEGAIQTAMENTDETIWGKNILLTGFGRISKVLCKLLVAFGANVSVYARKCSDLAWCEIYNCKPLKELTENISQQQLIFNTVPAMLFDEKILKKLNKETLIIDLASKPGGVDFKVAEELGIKAIQALSLPGKVAPVTAGEIIANTILNMLEEISV